MGSPESKVQGPESTSAAWCLVSFSQRVRRRNTKYGTRNAFYVSRFTRHSPSFCSAFTLLEVMIVVGIMGLMLSIGVPLIYKVWHRAPINQATADLFEVLSNARARAILQGKQVDFVFHPREGRFEIDGGGGAAAGSGQVTAGLVRGAGNGTYGRLPESVVIRMLDINKLQHDFLADEVARVRFYPNGTSDELTLILQSGADQRGVTLEITTGLASVLGEADLQKLLTRTL